MVTDLKSILALADGKGCAIPAFNVYNMEGVIGVMHAAQETHAPVIFQIYSRLFDRYQAAFIAPMIKEAIQQLETPAVFHLDHGSGIPSVLRALRLGVSGAMIDASTLPLEQNISITRRAVEICAECGVPVEGELGHVGSTADEAQDPYTDPDEAARFVRDTGISALAAMVGTAHGRYKQAPVLDIQRIRDIRVKTGVPIVLHGGSGVPDGQIRASVEAGVRKANFATDVSFAFLDSVFAAQHGSIGALDRFMEAPTEAIKRYCVEKIRLLGADRIL